MRDFLTALTRGAVPMPACGGLQRDVSFQGVDAEALRGKLLDRGIASPHVLAERGLICRIEIDYYQAALGAHLSFELEPDGYLGEYYRGVTLDRPGGTDQWLRNPPHAYRFEPSIDFDWGGTGRLPRVGADRFSARWWGTVELPVGRWQFRLTSDDGVRLFLDDRLLIDRWTDQSASTSTAIVDLAGARRELRVEYYERGGSAVCKLEAVRQF